jgi:NAD+ synthase (glutamine-hydrolysing)
VNNGYFRVAAATPLTKPADCASNASRMSEMALEAYNKGASLIVFPELSITGYTCSDLFLQESLLEDALAALRQLAQSSTSMEAVLIAGFPLSHQGKLYNTAAVIHKGKVAAFVPKTFMPNYAEFYEMRHFAQPAWEDPKIVSFDGYDTEFGSNVLLSLPNAAGAVLAVEICEDLWAPIPPSSRHALAGATVIANLSASNETTGKDEYRRELVRNQSARLLCSYVYSCAGDGESTTDLVFPGHNLIAENGRILSESQRFTNGIIIADIDIAYLNGERRRNTSFRANGASHLSMELNLSPRELAGLHRPLSKTPFVPSDPLQREKRCEEIILMQAYGLKTRIQHVNAKNVVLGVSGGLDSTLALLVCMKAFDLLGLSRKGICCITMPCFGTTDRTRANALALIDALGATLREIPIADAVMQHFKDLGHDHNIHDLTYENSQARERTQVLMDAASQVGGFVIGTGDLSELALGFATYNGDHMSMYGVNASIPKTLIRYLIAYVADTSGNEPLQRVLREVLDTPVSPELLPPEDGNITQKTETILGPYEVHDFFLYHMMRLGYPPEKIMFLAAKAFEGIYSPSELIGWLEGFYRRFFANQFKRSCLPDGPKVGSVALSPRGDWRMPSDASARGWLDRIGKLKSQMLS